MGTLVMSITWPFLWENPIARFIQVFSFMSDNPTNLSVLFGGGIYRAGELPRRYLPFMLATTLTEPVWPLFCFGVLIGYLNLFKQNRNYSLNLDQAASSDSWQSLRSSLDRIVTRDHLVSLTLVLLWFVVLVGYVLLRRPALYDGIRHFLFILPPIFICAGFTFEFIIDHLARSWLRAGLVILFLSPGILGIVRLHPYEYTYYNSFIGGTSGAFRQYETDYWLTCYKEAVEHLSQTVTEPGNLYVHRESYIAANYVEESMTVRDLRGALPEVTSGDYVLVNTRTNEDRRVFKDAPPILQVGRDNALFCVIKQIP
jgi:hypothetical protein